MCGVAGFTNVFNNQQRAKLARQLGIAIDTRGGHAAGFLAVSSRGLRYGRTTETFEDASRPFLDQAAAGPVATMLHARFATCGADVAAHAHPFAIRREGEIKLFGMHNGTFNNHEAVGKKRGRKTDVDSEELFQLLADGDYDGVRELSGYGTAVWVDKDDPSRVRLVRLSETADLEIIKIKGAGAGFVFGSTFQIIRAGLEAAGLESETAYTLTCGDVIELCGDVIRYASEIPKLKVSWGYSYGSFARRFGNYHNWGGYGEDIDDVDLHGPASAKWDRKAAIEDGWTEKDLYRLMLESGEEPDYHEYGLSEDEADEIEEDVYGALWDSEADEVGDHEDGEDDESDPAAWDHVEDGPEVWRQLARLEEKEDRNKAEERALWRERVGRELLKEKSKDDRNKLRLAVSDDSERLEQFETEKG